MLAAVFGESGTRKSIADFGEPAASARRAGLRDRLDSCGFGVTGATQIMGTSYLQKNLFRKRMASPQRSGLFASLRACAVVFSVAAFNRDVKSRWTWRIRAFYVKRFLAQIAHQRLASPKQFHELLLS
jgi:hypothetical protein